MRRHPISRRAWTCTTLIVLAGAAIAAIAAENVSGGVQVNGEEVDRTPVQASEPERAPTYQACVNHCNAAETSCSSEVRRARMQCARNAANRGRDPFPGSNDYTYFCAHFRNPGRTCGSDIYTGSCEARYNQRYGVCIDAMYDNVASMRYDCYKGERDAQKFCRDELRECKAACQ